ncbi:MAG TPA: tRNA pseudouridine(38-40) synthase TruA [bacterium]|nr:tRNA pseudouridine(38-40) synthase TruA [bacterium]
MSRNIKLIIEYDGTGYAGWQRLRGRPSIQGEIERAILAVTKERVTVIGAGRTDAGVHALGQVANFSTTHRIAVDRIPGALNHHLPPAIRILEAAEVPVTFHARYDARRRVYRYAVLNRPAPSAILRHHAVHVPRPLDEQAMAQALARLIGTHPFTAFRATGSAERTTLCTMHQAQVARSGPMVLFTFEADRFLRHMVRLIVGTVLRVGEGKLPPDALAAILAAEDNSRAGPRAPAHGLFLVRVTY